MFNKMFIYGIGIFFSKIIVFFLIPIYTRVFSPADYGYFDVLTSNLNIIVSIAFIEIWSGVIRFMFGDDSKLKPLKVVIKLLPIFLIIYSLLFFILSKLMIIKFPIISFIFGISYFTFSLMTSTCRGLGLNVDYIISGIISSISGCILSILFVVTYKKGIEYLLISQIIGYLMASLYVEFRTHAIWNAFFEKVNIKYINNILKYCLPLLVNSFSYIFLSAYNKNLILSVVGETASGIYAYILKFTAILSVALSIFYLAWQEFAFENSEDLNRSFLYSEQINSYIRLIGFGVPIYIMALYYFSPIFGGPSYIEASKYIPLAVCASFVADFSGVLSVVIAVSKKTFSILFSTIIGALFNIIIITLFIKSKGITGSNIGLLVGFSCTAIIRFYCANKFSKLRINYKIFILFLLIMVSVNICYMVKSNVLNLIVVSILILLWFCLNYKELIYLVKDCYLKIKRNKYE